MKRPTMSAAAVRSRPAIVLSLAVLGLACGKPKLPRPRWHVLFRCADCSRPSQYTVCLECYTGEARAGSRPAEPVSSLHSRIFSYLKVIWDLSIVDPQLQAHQSAPIHLDAHSYSAQRRLFAACQGFALCTEQAVTQKNTKVSRSDAPPCPRRVHP